MLYQPGYEKQCKALCDPMQDYMGLDNSCRMNQPSTVGKNWKWRIRKRELTVKLQKEIQGIALRYGRMNWSD